MQMNIELPEDVSQALREQTFRRTKRLSSCLAPLWCLRDSILACQAKLSAARARILSYSRLASGRDEVAECSETGC